MPLDSVRLVAVGSTNPVKLAAVRAVLGSLAMPLPSRVARMIRDGAELGDAMDALVAGHNTKQGAGAVGILTGGLVDRQRAYEMLVTYALAPLLTPDHWP